MGGGTGNGMGYVNGGGYSVAPQHGGTPTKKSLAAAASSPASPVGGQSLNGGGAQGTEGYPARAR
jgi:hypothetical protein